MRGLGVDDEFAGDGGGDEGSVGGALDLLDGVDGGGGDDGGTVLLDGGDGAVDGGGVYQGTDRIVDEDDVVVGGGGEGGEGVGDGVLASVSAVDNMDFSSELVLGEELVYAGLLGGSDGDVDGGDAGDGEEGSQGVEEDGLAFELEELLGRAACGGGHAGADSGGGDDDEDRHGNVSIARCGTWGVGRARRGGWGTMAANGVDLVEMCVPSCCLSGVLGCKSRD